MIGLTVMAFVGVLIWLVVSTLIEWMEPVWRFIGIVVGFNWDASGAIRDFGPFKILPTTLLICVTIFSSAFVWRFVGGFMKELRRPQR